MQKGARTRQHIIEQAAPAFNQHGFSRTAMSDLMAATGLEKGGLYRHFASKDELAAAAFSYAAEVNTQLRFEHLAGLPSATAKLKAFIEHFANTRSPIAGGCVIFNTAVDADGSLPELRDLAKAALNDWLGRLRAIITDGITEGSLAADTDTASLAAMILCSLEGALIASRLLQSDQPLQAAAAHLLQAVAAFSRMP